MRGIRAAGKCNDDEPLQLEELSQKATYVCTLCSMAGIRAHQRSWEAWAAMACHAMRGSCTTQQAADSLPSLSRVDSADTATSQGPKKVRHHPVVSCTYRADPSAPDAVRCTHTPQIAEPTPALVSVFCKQVGLLEDGG